MHKETRQREQEKKQTPPYPGGGSKSLSYHKRLPRRKSFLRRHAPTKRRWHRSDLSPRWRGASLQQIPACPKGSGEKQAGGASQGARGAERVWGYHSPEIFSAHPQLCESGRRLTSLVPEKQIEPLPRRAVRPIIAAAILCSGGGGVRWGGAERPSPGSSQRCPAAGGALLPLQLERAGRRVRVCSAPPAWASAVTSKYVLLERY